MPSDILKLNSMGLLEVVGPDAAKFLQGQLTCDVQQASDKQWLAGAHCNHKGRMIANLLILNPEEERFLLCLKRDLIDTLKASLDKYIVFSKADTRDLSETHDIFGLLGTPADALPAPTARIDDQTALCWQESSEPSPQLTQGDDILWQQNDIKAGRGWISATTSEEFLPQMLNLDSEAIAGISFKKGCYTGQEIVARMHYKGQTKKRLYAFETSNEHSYNIGDNLYTCADHKAVGTVLNIASGPELTCILAVASVDLMAAKAAIYGSESSEKLQQIELPYAITD